MSSHLENFDSYYELNRSKRELKETTLNKYTKTTQIVHLPGGIKRDTDDINDNKVYSIKNDLNYSARIRILRENRSKVTCLPGSYMYNNQTKDSHVPNEKILNKYKDKYYKENQDYNIISPRISINIKKNNVYSEYNKINIEKAKLMQNGNSNNDINMFRNNYKINSSRFVSRNLDMSDTSVERKYSKGNRSRRIFETSQDESKLVENVKSKRPSFIKNPFESQFKFL